MLLFISLFFKEGIINKLIEMNSLIKICPYCKKHMKYALVESVKIEDIKSIKTITGHTDSVNSLLLLKDGRVASCSNDKTIRIYDPSNVYHCDQVIKRHSESIRSICQLDDGIIVSGSDDKYQ